MIRKLIYLLLPVMWLGGCAENMEDCPSGACIMAGGWRLKEIRLDGQLYTGSLENFQLVLHNPSDPTENTSTFQRISVSGTQDTGSWSLENTNPQGSSSFRGSILRLVPDNNPALREDWNIEHFTPRQMILILERDIAAKDGPAVIRFILEPF